MALFTPDQLMTLKRAHTILADVGAQRVSIELRGSSMASHWHAEKQAEGTIDTLAHLIGDRSARLGPQEE